jgi:hypothetical protein
MVMLFNMARPTFQMKKNKSPPMANQITAPKEGI